MAKAIIFFGSFLTFALELTVGRTLLPFFGSAASVWVTSLCVFQVLLVAGYAYGAVFRNPRVHAALLLVASVYTICVAPVLPYARLGLGAASSAWASVAVAVLAASGPVFVLFCANCTLVQRHSGGEYGLYAWSNLGSLAGLAFGALVLDPFVPVSWQWRIIGVGGIAIGSWFFRRGPFDNDGAIGARDKGGVNGEPLTSMLPWAVLSGIGSASMTAATAYVTSDIIGVPLVWAVILGIYLTSWAVAFSRWGERLYLAFRVLGAAATLCVAVAACTSLGEPSARFLWNSVAVAGFLFFGLTALHSKLYSLRPPAKSLGRYYLAISAGGAVGGVLAAVVAPIVFSWVAEWPLCIAAVACAIAAGGVHGASATTAGRFALRTLPVVVAAVLFVGLVRDSHDADGRIVRRERGFYGVLTVREKTLQSPYGEVARRSLFNGRTCHGFQVDAPSMREKPSMYYSLNGGGIAFTNHPSYTMSRPMEVGMVGLGIGTLAAYGRSGDVFTFYEISREDIRIAKDDGLFTYLSDSCAAIDIREGDARIELAKDRDSGKKFDILVIDAYSGDAVPIHLVTAEAFRLYADIVKDDGMLALHVSNWHVDLWPIVKAAAREIGFDVIGVSSDAVPGELAAATDWAFLMRSPRNLIMPTCCHRIDWDKVPDRRLPTDMRGSLLPFIKFNFAAPIKD